MGDQTRLFLTLALRNLARHPRRTLLTLSSIAFGLAVLLLVQSVIAGRGRQMVDTVTSTSTGHLQVHKQGFLKNRSVQLAFSDVPAEVIQALPKGSSAGYRAYLPSLISSGEQSTPITLIGVDPLVEPSITRLKSTLIEGEYLTQETDPTCPTRQIYIGKTLQELLNVQLGEKLVILAQAADGTLGNELFRVKGIFDTGSQAFDKTNAYAPILCVRKVGAIPGAHELAIHLADAASADQPEVLGSIARALPKDLALTDWKTLSPLIAGMIAFGDAIVLMITFVLFAVITVGIVNTLFMSVAERTHEFGVMGALGVSPSQLLWIIFIECLVIAIAALLVGSALGISAVTYYQQVGLNVQPFMGERHDVASYNLDPIVFPVLTLGRYLRMAGLAAFAVVASGVYPAYLASRLNPVEAINSPR